MYGCDFGNDESVVDMVVVDFFYFFLCERRGRVRVGLNLILITVFFGVGC